MKDQSVQESSFFHSEIGRDILFLAGLAIAVRLIIHFTFLPAWGGDAGGYWDAGNRICHDRAAYDFGRTPAYPLILKCCQGLHDPSTIPGRMSYAGTMTAVLLQHLCGIALCCMLYKTLQLEGRSLVVLGRGGDLRHAVRFSYP